MRKESLHMTADREFIRRLLQAGYCFDLERDGHFDARSGVVNIWCSPDDKPACWGLEITRGGLPHPREYVGALGWDWRDDGRAELYVEACPYTLLERRPRRPLAEADWQAVLAWLREKAMGLVRLARLQPRVVGTRCPFCDFILPASELLNGLLDHVAAAHPEVCLREVTLGDVPSLNTDRGNFPLRPAEQFD